jgi:glycosyltransferase involved in cell wall biosynthesis
LTKLRIAVLNNYNLSKVETEVSRLEVPNHLLFGINYLRKHGHTITNFSVSPEFKNQDSHWKQSLYSFFHLENLNIQREVFRRFNEFDLIYCLCGGVSEWLYLQNSRKIINKPILTLYHHPLPDGKLDPIRNIFRKNIYRNQKNLITLSARTASSFNGLINRQIAEPIQWGVDHEFYSKITPSNETHDSSEILLTCGRTSRDLSTFSRAIKIASVKAHVICPKEEVHRLVQDDDLISVDQTTYSTGKKVNTYQKMADLMYKVRVIGIPLEKQNTLAGLTSLLDCLGFGKPVIMTKNPCIDLDIENLGIGTWVDAYDVDGWARAIKWHFKNIEQSNRMGLKAKAIGKRLSAESFGKKINSLIIEHYQNWKFN